MNPQKNGGEWWWSAKTAGIRFTAGKRFARGVAPNWVKTAMKREKLTFLWWVLSRPIWVGYKLTYPFFYPGDEATLFPGSAPALMNERREIPCIARITVIMYMVGMNRLWVMRPNADTNWISWFNPHPRICSPVSFRNWNLPVFFILLVIIRCFYFQD